MAWACILPLCWRLMIEVKSHKDLIVWQKAIELVLSVYTISKRFPKEEAFGLTSQVRRACVSVPSNIAEGWGRGSTKSYLQFLRISRGSLSEVETQLTIACKLDYISTEQDRKLNSEISEISKMLNSLIRKLEMKL